MPVLEVTQIFAGERFSEDVDKSEKTLVYRVRVDDIDIEPEEVKEADDGTTAIPVTGVIIGDYTVKSKEADRDEDNPNLFTVRVTLSDAQDEPQGSGSSGGSKFNVDLSMRTVPYEEVTYFDSSGQSITNTAGQPFSNQPTRIYYDRELVVSFDSDTVDVTNIDLCMGKLNLKSVVLEVKGVKRIFKKGTLKMVDEVESARPSEAGFLWHIEYHFLYRKDGWKRKILSMGRIQKDDEPCHMKNGQVATEDMPLDLEGTQVPFSNKFETAKVANDELSADPAVAGKPCYYEFEIEDRANFAALLAGI